MADRRKGVGVGTTRGLRSAAFALVGVGLALVAGGSAASAARSDRVSALRTVISPQYQAKIASQVVGAEPHGFTAGPSSGGVTRVVAEADLLRGAAWYHRRALQYQLTKQIANQASVRNDTVRLSSAHSTVPGTASPRAISIVGSGLDQKDERLLVRLGLILAGAYAVFLVAWLWGTRIRPHHRRRAVRY